MIQFSSIFAFNLRAGSSSTANKSDKNLFKSTFNEYINAGKTLAYYQSDAEATKPLYVIAIPDKDNEDFLSKCGLWPLYSSLIGNSPDLLALAQLFPRVVALYK